jgi:energy-coupling factor transporter ATP-binding protein EcfA2
MSGEGSASLGGSSALGVSLACRAVSFSYSEGGASIRALHDVSFSIPAGDSMALIGASGSGKSTLLQVIRGLDEPEGGAVVLDGVEPGAAGYAERQREVGLVFQAPEVQLFAATARDDVAFGPRRLGWSEQAVTDAVARAFELVGLSQGVYAERHPYSLSGGEARRLALAGVLAMRPRLVLLDEPFVGLDPGSRRDLVSILESLKGEGITLLLVTHDLDLAWRLCEQRLVLADGRVAAAGVWDFAGADAQLLAANRLREPFLVELWRRLAQAPGGQPPRTLEEAAEALT